MAYVPRLLLINCNRLKYNKQGIFATYYVTAKLFHNKTNSKAYFTADSLYKSSILKSFKMFSSFGNIQKVKSRFIAEKYEETKFSKVNLTFIIQQASSLPDEILVCSFNKLCVIYYLNRHYSWFDNDLRLFANSCEFKKFCSLLDKKLPKLPPSALIDLLNLTIFQVPVRSTLMRKVLTLILDNVNYFTVCDILEIYCRLSEEIFEKSEEAKNILKMCDFYFENVLEDELSHCKLLDDLIIFLCDKRLPVEIRKLIMEKFFYVLGEEFFRTKILTTLFSVGFEEPIFSLVKPELMKHFKDTISILKAKCVQKALIGVYENAVKNYEYMYDEEICSIFAKNCDRDSIPLEFVPFVMEKLCLMGYFDRNLVELVSNFVLSLNFSNCKPQNALSIVCALSRANVHEMNIPNWEKIKNILESYNATKNFANYFPGLLKWCECLIFLGCDIRNALSQVFSLANEGSSPKFSVRDNSSIVRLHHLAKAYFSSGYEVLDNKVLKNYLKKSFSKNFYARSGLKEIFVSDDYILEGCVTPDNHFLDLVVILGADKKPTDLSSYKARKEETLIINHFCEDPALINVEEIKRPENSKVLVFQKFSDHQPKNFRNAPMTSGNMRMFLKSFEGLDYNIILLNDKFLDLNISQKIECVQLQIDEIVKNNSLVHSVIGTPCSKSKVK